MNLITLRGTYRCLPIRLLVALIVLGNVIPCLAGTKIALKTNVISDAMANINFGGEVIVAPKWSVDVSWDYNNWSFSEGKRWKHWLIQPEARYWFCDAIDGHFMAAHLIGGKYNFGHIDIPVNFLGSDFRHLKDYRYQGWGVGAGIGYGYSWAFAKHWNIEAEIGVGYIFTRYDVFECEGCGRELESNLSHNYFGPTKLALNLVYVF